MTIQTAEDPALSTEKAEAKDDCAEESLANGEGWRIAREALLREIVRYGGQGALVLALLGVIGYAGYWSLKEMRSLPEFVQRVSQPFMPPAVAPAERPVTATTRPAQEKATSKAVVKKHFYHPRQIASKIYRRPSYAPTASDPTGGHIIYSDGMITQYSWNK